MMPGLLEGQEKMSKSDPNSAIFMEDSEAEVSTKIKKAFCPPQVRRLGRWTHRRYRTECCPLFIPSWADCFTYSPYLYHRSSHPTIA